MNKKFRHINYYWRLIATGISFSLFGVGGLILGYVILPFITLIAKNPRSKNLKAQSAISRTFRLFTFAMEALGVVNFKFRGIEKLSEDKGCLIVSNHPTLIDIVVLISKMKHCNIIVKEKLWSNPFMKRVIETAGYIPNSGREDLAARITSTLKNRDNLFIFPEGTRSTPNQPLKLQRGAAQIAIRTPAPIRLVKINCSFSCLTKQDKWYHIPPQRPDFVVEVGECIDPRSFLEKAQIPSLAARHLTQYLKNELEGLRETA